jgi:hypothetical protein
MGLANVPQAQPAFSLARVLFLFASIITRSSSLSSHDLKAAY